ncbi:MAG TPA: GvpL/GvpF family gas vesicle protein [Ktedonobacteraceae bacterium]|jgi:hypothetical protein
MDSGEGCYIYGVIATDDQREFGPIGIGGRGDRVYTLPDHNVATIISRSPIKKYPVARDTVMAHAKVLERVGEEYTVLPVRFSTIAADEQTIVEKLLRMRRQEFLDLSRTMEGKLELGVRARWIDMEAIFAELVEENNDIKALKEASQRERNAQRKYADLVRVGELVQSALKEKKRKEANELLDAFIPFSTQWKEMQIYGDMNIVSAAFLVDRENESCFDQKVNEIRRLQEKRKQLRYTVSPVAYNFVELVVTW